MNTEAFTSTYISTDEEMIMLRNPKSFPTVKKACMGSEFRDKSLMYTLLDSPYPNDKQSENDEDYIKYAIIRNIGEETDFEKIMKIITLKHQEKQQTLIKNQKWLRLKVLSYLHK